MNKLSTLIGVFSLVFLSSFANASPSLTVQCAEQAFRKNDLLMISKIQELSLSLSTLIASQSLATTIVSASAVGNSSEVAITIGFPEDGFEGPASVCYIGERSGVCEKLQESADKSRKRYHEGEHGFFKVNTCELNGGEVLFNYQRITDYDGTLHSDTPIDGVAVQLTIPGCEEE